MRLSVGRGLVAAVAAGLLAGGITASLAVPRTVDAADPSGPVAEWTFDEAAGTTAKDVVGNLDGTLSGGVTRVTGNVPQGTGALAFDGVDDLVTVANAAALEPAGALTVAFWFETATPPASASDAALIAKGFLGPNRGGSYEVALNYMMTVHGTANVTTSAYPLSTGTSGPGYGWTDDTWHLAAYSVDPGAASSMLFLDGHTWSRPWPAGQSVQYAGPDLVDSLLRFGGRGTGSTSGAYRGALDDVRLWDRALPASELLATMGPIPTTTTVDPVGTAYLDERLTFGVRVAPWPASPGDITWYRSTDGGPEEVFATTPLRIEDMTGYAFAYQEPGTLAPGAYTIRAAWSGAGNWQASTSAAMPLEITKRPVSMSGSANPDAVVPGGSTTLSAHLSATTTPSGSVEFHETTGSGDVLLGSGVLSAGTATLGVTGLAAGTHAYEARYAGTETLAPATAAFSVTAGPQVSSVDLSFSRDPVLSTQHATAIINLGTSGKGSSPGPLPAPTGTLTVKAYPGGVAIGSVPVTNRGEHQLVLPVYPTGTRQFTVDYSGDANFDPAVGTPATLTIVSDTVEATGVGVSAATFYPYRDGHLDTVAIRGTRLEAASVSVRVYSPLNRLVGSASIPSAPGAYASAWNGRTAIGTLLAVGKYKVVQVLTDTAGTSMTVTNYVNLSAKRIYTYTKSLTRTPTQTSKRTARWGGWQFKLPAATVYKKLTFKVYARSASGDGGFGPHDYTECGSSDWTPYCVAKEGRITKSYTWVSVGGSTTKNRSGQYVRLYAWANSSSVWLKYARVTVTYGILK